MLIRYWSSDLCASDLSASSSVWSPSRKRVFSPSAIWPGSSSTPSIQFDTSGTVRPSAFDNHAATSVNEASGSSLPAFGRPRGSEVHTSELPSLMRNTYAVFRLNNKTQHELPYNYSFT